jgi:predicted S18 family serine protease
MSRKVSMPRSRSRPSSGRLNWLRVAAITTSEARGTPATPLLVSIRVSSMAICVSRPSWMS